MTDYCGNAVYENGVPKKLLTGYGYVSLNNNKYHYFIRDHQGNNRVVVDEDGTVEERNDYYPFGGLMASSSDSVQPYKYNGKELDRKGGLDWYDYGVRHYDAVLGRFIAVDPLAGISSSVNPYTYCLNNPFNRIDPTGMISRYNWDKQRYEDEQGNEVSWESVQQEYGIGGSRNDSNITPWSVGVEWLTGNGPRDRIFVDGDYFTELLKKHEHIEDVRSMIISSIRERKELNQSQPYRLSGLQGVGKYIKDYSTLMTLGTTGNLAVTYLGSYSLKWHLISLDRSTGIVVVKFVVSNSSTIESGTRPPVLGYTDFWKNNIGNRVNKFFESGPMSKTTQTFQWIETLKF